MQTKWESAISAAVEGGGFDTALLIYNTIVEEKALQISRDDDLQIMELSSRRWRQRIPLSDLRLCENMQGYICLLKEKAK